MSAPFDTSFAAARRLHTDIQDLLDHAAGVLAIRCADGSHLDGTALDARQVACHALAFASAELAAAGSVLDGADPPSLTPGSRLSLAGAAESLQQACVWLDTLLLELGLPSDPLHALRAGTDLNSLRRTTLAAEALCPLADSLMLDDGDIGHVRFSDEEQAARAQFRRLSDEVIAPLAGKIHREDLTVPEVILEPLRAMGAFGLSIPESFGGSAPEAGGGHRLMIATTEILSEASLGAAGSLITRPEILGRALLAGGTEEQKRRWLPAIAAGQPLCAIAITEPDYGSDVAGLTLRATRCKDGWQLSGAKTWCTFAGKAGLLMVVARTNPARSLGHRGLSLLLVEKPSHDGHAFEYRPPGSGCLTGRAIPTLGYRGMHSFDLAFDDFFVPDTHVIGGEAGLGRGFYFAMAGMDGGRIQTAARALGVMRGALRQAIGYASDRKVFGRTLIDYPLTKAGIARMAARLAVCRQFAYAVGDRMDRGGGRMEASLVKLFSCRAAEQVARDAMQLFGGLGYAEESPVSRHFVDARVLSIFEGAEETLALKVVAKSLLEAALATASPTPG